MAVVAVLSACGASGSLTTSSTTSSTPAPAVPAADLLPTTIETTSFTDTTRAVVSHGVQIAAVRVLPVAVERPQETGRFPLVVFAPGYDAGPLTYGLFIRAIAQRGYVVVAPSFPLEDPHRGNGLDRADLPNEAQDLRVVLADVLSGPLRFDINAAHITLLGHSDGADAVLQAAFEPGHTDAQIGSVIAMSPDALNFTPVAGGPPAVVIQGTNDDVVDPMAASDVLSALSDERFEITIRGADHASSVIGTTPLTPSVDGVVLAALKDLGRAPELLMNDVKSFSAVSIREVGSQGQ